MNLLKERTLYGANVVVIGAGGIALECIRLLQPFETNITVVRRSDRPVAGANRTCNSSQLHEVLPDADVVVMATALTESTEKLLGAAELELMKESAILVNIARGGLIDTDALVSALASAAIAGAGLDVTDPEPLPADHPLWSEPRALITPHNATTPEMSALLLAERVRVNVEALHGDGRFVGVVNLNDGY